MYTSMKVTLECKDYNSMVKLEDALDAYLNGGYVQTVVGDCGEDCGEGAQKYFVTIEPYGGA